MDDTVFDHALTCRAAIGRIRRELRILRKFRLDDLWAFYSRALEETHADVLRGRLTGGDAREKRWRGLVTHFTGECSRAEARDLADRYRREYLAAQRPVAGSIELLRRLHGRTVIAIVTNNEVAEQERKLRFLEARDLVDHLVVSEEVGAEKPDPRIFRVALRRAGVRAPEAVMIGDSWTNDIVGALRTGIRPIWFNRFHLARPPGTSVDEIDSLRPAGRVERLLARDARRAPAPARIISRGPMQPR